MVSSDASEGGGGGGADPARLEIDGLGAELVDLLRELGSPFLLGLTDTLEQGEPNHDELRLVLVRRLCSWAARHVVFVEGSGLGEWGGAWAGGDFFQKIFELLR